VIGDALNAEGMVAAVASSAPDAVIHALTAIPRHGPLRASDLRPTNRLRIEGTRNRIGAAIAAQARRVVVESMVFVYGYGDLGPDQLTEDRLPAETAPEKWLLPSIRALADEEEQVLEASRSGRIEGVVLRFGGFYGPGAGIELMTRLLRRCVMPLPKKGCGGEVSWIHIQDAAAATVAALYRGHPGGVYNIADDHPALFGDVVRELARRIAAPPPLSVPKWLVRLFAPFMEAAWIGTTLKVSNSKAKQELQWTPRFASYRDGIAEFAAALAKAANAKVAVSRK
jgi:2-alkyl-3-oxoalkanoate reductase